MMDDASLRLIISLHCRTVVGLIDAADRAGTTEQRNERIAIARDAVLEFKQDMLAALPKP